jgi:cytoskeletal protein CcmA (bactofilin family)
MWKKDEDTKPTAETATRNAAQAPPPSRKQGSSAKHEHATIGRSITIRGDVTGDEDLYIQGCIEGTVDLKQHSVTIGPEGRVKADLAGRTVTIEGEVDGDVRGQEQVSLRASSRVNGDITAPRVVLEDGARFLGSIDMSGSAPDARSAKDTPKPVATTAASKTAATPAGAGGPAAS